MLDAHGAAVLAMLRRLCRNAHDADDLFQETAVRVWRSFHQRPRLRNPRAWLMTIAYRVFADFHSRRVRHQCFDDSPDHRANMPEAKAERDEERVRVNEAVARLSKPIREVVILHYTGGLSLRQTAQAMGISEGTVKSRLSAALKKLRSVLE